jgi:hypothetical protein
MGRYPAPGDLVLVTLQTDTVMLDPNNVRSLAVGSDLNALYGDYWRLLSDDGSGPALVLKDFYAYQNFAGGYRYHRYLGAAERRSAPNRYRPFYLTGAGSVFKLEVTDANRAWQILDQWTQQGLDLPAWAVTEYGRSGFALWQTCPYLPENGYGEIAVNLRWHWDEQI